MASKVDSKQVELACKALLDYVAKEQEGKMELLDNEEFISIVIALKRTPEKARVKPFRIPLTHSLYKDKSLCLFAKDDGDKNYKTVLQENPVQGVEKVIGVTKLRKNYRQYKDRRDLLATYDMFMADDRVIPALPALLGKKFFDKKKHPVPVNLNKKDIVAELKKARDSTYFHLPAGASCMVKVGLTSFTKQELMENIVGCLDHVVKNIPKKWKNVQALYVRTATSVALPFYNSLPTSVKIDIDTIAPKASTPSNKRKRGLSAPAPEEATAKKTKKKSVKKGKR